ncbi:efflux RND transporter periplasmic adaptor subunit [Microterricola viridarii]|uniref:Peptidoglycan binding domain-containing protein n=1 Tax=Microterricola viridarii TaxID=412690 RepID=A0A1H1SCN8_9MICO|nr:hypothetical protein [Microterricola viridarii]SDS45506.1 hypothetical protein SAMN04489834_1511 [Microterricola viridarii]
MGKRSGEPDEFAEILEPTPAGTGGTAEQEPADPDHTDQAPVDAAPADQAPADPAVSGWRRVLHGNRALWVLAAVAVVSLVAGVALSAVIVSPGQAAADAKPPEPGLITVPVELRSLSNDVTLRGDVQYADSVEVTLESGDRGGPAVVTGRVPEAGATLEPGSVALEVAGRPVIVLPGELPVYRSLRLGLAGPDVTQLKDALRSLGIDPGGSNTFDAATAAAIGELYARVGYPAPEPAEGSAAAVRGARDGVRSAEEGLASAQRALNTAASGASEAVRIQLDNRVRNAELALEAAKNPPAVQPDDPTKPEVPGKPNPQAVAAAEGDLALAIAERSAGLAAPDTSGENSAIGFAQRALEDARLALTAAEEGTLTFLPSSEVIYLAGLPRRVDEVMAKRGTVSQGAVMRVSGAELVLAASAAESDAKLLTIGDIATVTLDDTTLEARVTAVEPRKATGKEAGARYNVSLALVDPTPDQVASLQGQNVRIAIPIGATAGEVLAVPAAALTAGAGGESRVEVYQPGEKDTRLVAVTTGLAAEGFVEISGDIEEGEQVVVGR